VLNEKLGSGCNSFRRRTDPALSSGPAQFAAIQSMAPPLGMEVTVNMRNASEIERAIADFARAANRGPVDAPERPTPRTSLFLRLSLPNGLRGGS
jgi:hypothetical protein